MNLRFGILSFILLVAGCGPGMLDYTDRIGDTKYDITRTDSKSHRLLPNSDCGKGCPSISRDILAYRSNKFVIAVRRQVVQDYFCEGPAMTSQYLNSYEQYVILLESNKLVGPMNIAVYKAFVKDHPLEMADIDLLSETDQIDGNGTPLNTIHDCKNARPAGD